MYDNSSKFWWFKIQDSVQIPIRLLRILSRLTTKIWKSKFSAYWSINYIRYSFAWNSKSLNLELNKVSYDSISGKK